MAEITLKDDLSFYCMTCEKEVEADQRSTGRNKGIYVERCQACLQKDNDDRDELIARVLELEEELAEIRRAS